MIVNYPTIDSHRKQISLGVKEVLESKELPLYDMMSYHFGFHEDMHEVYSPTFTYGSMLVAAYGIFGGDCGEVLPAAVATEFINGFCEIHDDIESGIPKRGNQDSLWWVWGPAQAINVGDGMHALARISALKLLDHDFSSEETYTAINLLDEACLRACEGRFRDLEMQELIDVSLARYQKMASAKSGALFGSSLAIAAMLNGFDPRAQQNLIRCGHLIGEYCQIKNDINELWPTDPNVNLEFLNKKKLYPVLVAMERASPSEKRKLGDVYFKRVLESSDIAPVLEVVEGLGGREASEERIEGCKESILSILGEICRENEGAECLLNLVNEGK